MKITLGQSGNVVSVSGEFMSAQAKGWPTSTSGKTRIIGNDRGKAQLTLPSGQTVEVGYTLSVYTKDEIDDETKDADVSA